MNCYINIHTHNYSKTIGKQITNILYTVDPISLVNDKNIYSIGLHPWHIKNSNSIITSFTEIIKRYNIIAIGETGIDRVCTTPLILQEQIFKQHIDISEKEKKPLIIHSVHSYYDILKFHKKHKPIMPWILHGYNGNQEITKQFLKYNIYFSLGQIQNNNKINNILNIIPRDRLFVETDNAKISITEVYSNISLKLNIVEEELKEIISQNFNKVFINE